MKMDTPGPSEPKRMIDVVAPPGTNWIVQIHDAPLDIGYLHREEVWDRRVRKMKKAPRKEDIGLTCLELVYAIDTKPEALFKYMMEECSADTRLIVSLAQHLSAPSVSKILRKLFRARHTNEHFVGFYFDVFFSNYLERCYSWFSLDLLKRARAAWPGPFRRLIKSLFQNLNVPKQVLQDYVANIDDAQRNELMMAIIEIDFFTEEFIHHMPTINALFLHSEKSPEIVRYIYGTMEAHACHCYVNRDFGKLLLSLLKNLGDANLDQGYVKRLIEKHGSEYKAPCLIEFDDVLTEIMGRQYAPPGFRRFRVRVQRTEEPGLRAP